MTTARIEDGELTSEAIRFAKDHGVLRAMLHRVGRPNHYVWVDADSPPERIRIPKPTNWRDIPMTLADAPQPDNFELVDNTYIEFEYGGSVSAFNDDPDHHIWYCEL